MLPSCVRLASLQVGAYAALETCQVPMQHLRIVLQILCYMFQNKKLSCAARLSYARISFKQRSSLSCQFVTSTRLPMPHRPCYPALRFAAPMQRQSTLPLHPQALQHCGGEALRHQASAGATALSIASRQDARDPAAAYQLACSTRVAGHEGWLCVQRSMQPAASRRARSASLRRDQPSGCF